MSKVLGRSWESTHTHVSPSPVCLQVQSDFRITQLITFYFYVWPSELRGAYLALSCPATKAWMLWPIWYLTITPAPLPPAKLNLTSALFSLVCHDNLQVLERVRNFRICVPATYKSSEHPANDHVFQLSCNNFWLSWSEWDWEWKTMFLMNHLSQFKNNWRI